MVYLSVDVLSLEWSILMSYRSPEMIDLYQRKEFISMKIYANLQMNKYVAIILL